MSNYISEFPCNLEVKTGHAGGSKSYSISIGEVHLIRAPLIDSGEEVLHLQHEFATLQDLDRQSSQSQDVQPKIKHALSKQVLCQACG